MSQRKIGHDEFCQSTREDFASGHWLRLANDRRTALCSVFLFGSCLLMHETRLVVQSEAMGSGNGRITAEERSTPDALSKRILGARGSHGDSMMG